MTEIRAWPAAAVEAVPIETLLPYVNNARTHSPAQIETIAGLMLRFGVTNPVLRDDRNMILAGHGRVLAAKLNFSRGYDAFGRVPVITAQGWTEDEKRAYVIADNQSALMAGWDNALLASELQAVAGAGLDVACLGFSSTELRRRLGYAGGLTDPDEIPEIPEEPVTHPGDLWSLGSHRVLCGDSTNPNDVGRLLEEIRPHLMVTDPPYGVAYDPAWRARAGLNHNKAKLGNVRNDDRSDWRAAWALFPGDVAYVWHGALHASTVEASLLATKFVVRGQIIWAKDRFALGRGDYHWQHEPCFYAVREGSKSRWAGDRKQSTLWAIGTRDDSGHGHGTQKPVEVMRRPMENNSCEGDTVFDPFLGSGTTVIAAEQSQRTCLGLEIEPKYVDVIVRRWQNFTGEKALLVDTRCTFEDIAAERMQKGHGRKRTTTKTDVAPGARGQQRQTRSAPQ